MISPEQDRVYYAAGIEEVEQYLLSTELYWTMSARTTDLTQLTLGGLLLVRARLRGARTGGLESLDQRLDAVRSKWRSAWEGKARREVRARSGLWREYLGEYRRDALGASRLYPQNVHNRAMIALLDEQSDPMDVYLRSILLPGAFVWDAQVQDGFPPDEFWFLFGTLKF
jgi:hypothetical protein